MDAFFAAVEQRDFKQYRNKPIIVGGNPQQRSVVATCSYEARKFGIKSAMPSRIAQRLCPQAIFVKPRMEVYKQVSKIIRAIFYSYTDTVQPLSIDEAYLDVTGSTLCKGSATLIAKAIKQEIYDTVQLTASAGVSYNKLLAKIASDYQKPNGLTVITPEQGADFVKQLPVRKFYGVGKVTEQKMLDLGIKTGADLYKKDLEFLQQHFGKSAQYLFDAARGTDNRIVSYNPLRLSVSKEVSFEIDKINIQELLAVLAKLSDKVFNLVQPKIAKTVTIKVKYSNFQQVTRQTSVIDGIHSKQQMLDLAKNLLNKTEAGKRYIRLLGVGLSNWI